ncbi:MAG: hypothetical protein IKE05_04980, partial [Clostridia bacterium]|nr:hypothetical protein [Clostridia bacterium]
AAAAGGFSVSDACGARHAFLPLYLSPAPDDKYFKIYYRRRPLESDFCKPTTLYERFDYESWAQDVFHKDFKTVLKTHREVFERNGARWLGGTINNWDLTNLNLPTAEQEIDRWRAQCCQSC